MLHVPGSTRRNSTDKAYCDEKCLLEEPRGTPLRPFSIFRVWLTLASVVAFWLYFNSVHLLQLGHVDKETSTAPLEHALTSLVQWDKYSLFIKGQRVLLWSGEIHPWRIPVRSQWLDVLQKIKASGMNAISVYAHWGLHNPSREVLDYEHWRDWQTFLDMCNEVGLWVVFRPGPYINAETTAGGIPGWVVSETSGELRSNHSDYYNAWTPYIASISEIIRRNQITEGGPIIAVQAENEFTNSPNGYTPPFPAEAMAQLRAAFLDAGIVVPQTHNDAGMNGYFINGTGAVDLYGFDDYPQGFDCSHPYNWGWLTKGYDEYHSRAFPSSPLYIPELQAGAFDPWGPLAPTYDNCRILTDASFQNNLYYHMIASNAKMINLYMMYGGTSWGNIPFPGVYTSYDYGSAIRESRALSEKYDHLKLLGLFLRSVPELYHTDIIDISKHSTDDGLIVVTQLQNPVNKTGFYFIRHDDISSYDPIHYSLSLQIRDGTIQVPMVYEHFTLKGRTTDLIVTDLTFGASHLVYSSAPVLFAGTLSGRDVLVLYGDTSEGFESIVKLTGRPRGIEYSPRISILNSNHIPGHGSLVTILPGTEGLVEIWDSDTQLVLFCDTKTAVTFYSPVIAPESDDPFKAHWGIGTNSSVLVGGPHLVRTATLKDDELSLRGDLQGDTMLRLIGLPSTVRRVTWNGYDIEGIADLSQHSSIVTGFIKSRNDVANIRVPELGSWRYHDSLPEIHPGYDDSSWLHATNTTTNSPYKPCFGDGPVLYACDYGFCEGAVIWRGSFYSSGNGDGVRLIINGGEAFAASVWLNGHFLRTTYGNSTRNTNIIRETDEVYQFPESALRKRGMNVLTVLQDNMGLDETSWPYDAKASRSPRGIRGYSLLPGGRFGGWKVQGRLGGYRNFVDEHRGILNAGGFYGERQGWHLPGFPDDSWTTRDLSEGLPDDAAGLGFFRTEFTLDIPTGYDVQMSFEFEDEAEGQPYRALLFVNGWNMGKRVANLGPQSKFIVHEGILNYQGSNTLAVALWAMEPGHSIKPRLKLVIDNKLDGGADAHYEPAPSWSDLFDTDDTHS